MFCPIWCGWQAVRLHPEELAQRGSGQIASLLNIDVNNLSWSMPMVHELWATPLQLATCLYLLQKQIGAAAYTGLLVMALMAPPNMAVMRVIFKNQRAIMGARDQRIRLLSEVMGSIKAVKLMTWEGEWS
jgi:ABC-type siderophore export system fused ATPase/permease subunit